MIGSSRVVAFLSRIGVIVSVSLIAFSVCASQILMFISLEDAKNVRDDERDARIQVEEQIEALRERAINAEEADCVQIGRINDFVSVVARIHINNGDLTPEQRAEIEPFLTSPPRPAACR